MAFRLDYKRSALSKNFDEMSVKLGAVLLMYANTKASELQAKMKINRPARSPFANNAGKYIVSPLLISEIV